MNGSWTLWHRLDRFHPWHPIAIGDTEADLVRDDLPLPSGELRVLPGERRPDDLERRIVMELSAKGSVSK